jgi:hypothetical protein
MAISDLLWACPVCDKLGGINTAGACHCGVTFARARGARIRARMPDGRIVERTPAEWSDLLPDPASLLEGGAGGLHDAAPPGVVRRARVSAREVTGHRVVRDNRGAYLNRVELYGPESQGTLETGPERLVYRPEGQPPREWPLDALTAIQASSSTLQIKAAHRPLVSFRFLDDSLYLWESLLQAALTALYRRTGRGEIVEFQPRITVR